MNDVIIIEKCIISYLEKNCVKYENKIIFSEQNKEITYKDFIYQSKCVWSIILKYNLYNKPIVIFIDKTINALSSMFGVIYSANFYTVIDVYIPKNRIDIIINTLNPMLIIIIKQLIVKNMLFPI